jgi:transposase
MMFGAGWELRQMSISELMHRPDRARRLEVFTGVGRRRTWPSDEKAAIVAESYAPGRTVCGVARRHGLTPAQLFTWRRLARRARRPVQEPPVRFVPAVVEPSSGLPPPPASQPRRARRPGPVRGIEVERDGIVVRIGSGASPEAIAAVIRALKVGS